MATINTLPSKSREQARNEMSEYYQLNKTWIPKTIAQFREQIIDLIVQGKTAKQAFSHVLKLD